MGSSWPQKGFKCTERGSVVLLFFCSPIVLPLSACRLLPPPFFAWPLLCALCPRWYISPVHVPKQKIFCSVSPAMGKQTNALSPHLLILYFFATQNFNTFSMHFRFLFGRHINPTNFLFGKGWATIKAASVTLSKSRDLLTKLGGEVELAGDLKKRNRAYPVL